MHLTRLGAPIPKSASACGTSDANFEIKRGTSNFMILVRFLNLKFLHELAAQMIGTSNSPHHEWLILAGKLVRYECGRARWSRPPARDAALTLDSLTLP